MLLTAEGVKAGYGKIEVLHGMSLKLEQGELAGILGHNGAGKSTLLKTILGTVRATAGSIKLNGQEVVGRRPSDNVKNGIALAPQDRGVFRDMSVMENLELAAYQISKSRSYLREQLEQVFELFPVLPDRSQEKAGLLSGGQQQMLKIGMALVRRPSLLLLDEPSLGLAPVLVERVLENVKQINEMLKVAIILVEQNVTQTLAVVDQVWVIKTGELVFEGKSSELQDGDQLWNLF